MAKHKIRITGSDITYMGIIYAFLAFVAFAVAYPLVYVVSCSFSSPKALISGQVFLWPVDFSLIGYETVFKAKQVLSGYGNSILYTAVGTFINIAMTMIAAYPLSRNEFPAKKAITVFFSFTMFFGGGLIPSYLLIKTLGFMNTIWSMVIPGAMSVWMVIVTRTFIKSSIPEELFESASIDGCNYAYFFFRMVLPLSAPVIAVMAISYAAGHWNSYFAAMLYLHDAEKFPLQIVLRNILVQNVVDYSAIDKINVKDMMTKQYISELLKYSLIVISSIPLIIFYPFMQKYFIKGVMIGSLKG